MAYHPPEAPPGTSSTRSSDHDSPLSPDPPPAIRLRFLVPNPSDSLAVSKRILESLKDLQAARRSPDRDAYLVSGDQLDDLLLLAQQSVRNASTSSLASIEHQLTELTTKLNDVQQAVRSTRPWSRADALPPSATGFTPLVPLSDTPPSTSYSRDRQPVGFLGSDGRVYGLMEDQRRMWVAPGGPTWPRDYDPPRSSATAPAEQPAWHPIGRRHSRAEESQPPPGDQHVSRPEPGSSAAGSAYDAVRPHTGSGRRPSPILPPGPLPSSSALGGGDKGRSAHMVAPPSSGSVNNHTPSSTAVTDSSSKAPSISFLVNPSYDAVPARMVSRESRTPPASHPPMHPSLARYSELPHAMDIDGHAHHRSLDGYDGISAYSSSHSTSKLAKLARTDLTAPGKRRIRNGACTFCREKKLACRPGPMADDPNATGPPTCDQCYRRQRTCQHDPEHRRRRRTVIPPKKPNGTSEEDVTRSNGPVHYDVDAEDALNRMESEDPSVPADSPDRRPPRPAEPVKDEEVDQLETEWMQPD